MELEIYKKLGRFLPLNGKIPARSGNWRDNTISYPDALRRLELGGNFGFVIPPRIVVIDIDPRNGGAESYAQLLDDLSLPDLANQYPSVVTGGGGLHIYAALSKDHNYQTLVSHLTKYPGIDIKRHGGYVVGAGSIHPDTGRKYEPYYNPHKIPLLYPALVALLQRQARERTPTRADITPGQLAVILDQINVTDYQSNNEWFALMAAAHTATGGAGVEEFIAWSIKDPKYADHENQIRYRWESLRLDVDNPRTVATLYEAIDPDKRTEVSISMQLEAAPDMPGLEALRAAAGGYDVESDLPYQVAKKLLSERRLQSCGDCRFWEYRKTHWIPIQINLVKRYIFETFAAMDRDKSASGILAPTVQILEALTATPETPSGMPGTPGHSIVNCKNGEVWIDDLSGAVSLRPHNHESNQVYCLPIVYNPSARAPRFERFLSEIFPGKYSAEIARHLIEILGYTIQTRKNIATWVLLHGRGANGKTVLLSILSGLLGEAALEKPISTISTERNNHAMADLPGKLAIIDDDVSSHTVLPDGELKSLSENKWLLANPKNAAPFRFRSCVIPILSANMYPSTRDISDGLKRRVQVFDFPRQFAPEKQDVGLTDYILNNEMSGVLNILLAGLRRVRARGHFAPPPPCIEARETWYGSNNTVIDFMRNHMRVVPEAVVKFDEIWSLYNQYVIAEGIRKPMSKSKLRESLAAAGVRVTSRAPCRVVGYRLKKVETPE